MTYTFKSLLSALLLLGTTHAFAAAYHVPIPSESLIGERQQASTVDGDNVITIAKKYNIGFNAVKNANPQLDLTRRFLPGTIVQIPNEHLLPNQPRQGIVINLPEMRMYYYPEGTNQVYTYPIGIGKIGKTIPIRSTTITRKTKNPVWIPPQDIREFNLKQGIVLPRIMPAGPDNPLGPYAIYMGIPTFLIHSTIFPESIGTRASFGCIRMYESDIEGFFPTIKSGIPVVIINTPVKFGWQDNNLFMEAHEPLQEHANEPDATLSGAIKQIAEITNDHPTFIDWQLVTFAMKEKDGSPHEIGMKIAE